MYWEEKEKVHMSSKSRRHSTALPELSAKHWSTSKKVGNKLIPT